MTKRNNLPKNMDYRIWNSYSDWQYINNYN